MHQGPTLLLTGATGFIGSHIAAHFSGLGWKIVALSRKIPENRISDSIEWKIFDLAQQDLPELPERIDAFIHAGYIAQGKNNDALSENSRSALALLKALENKKTEHRIFISSLSADEQAPSVYGRQKAAIEKLFIRSGGTAVRAGLVLGQGGLFASMRNYLSSKKLIPLFGNGLQPIQFIYVRDLVDFLDAVMEKKLKGLLVAASDEPVPYRSFYEKLCQSLGTEPRFIRVPYWLAGMMIGFAGTTGMKLPVTKDNLLGLKNMKHIPAEADCAKAGIALMELDEALKRISAGLDE